MTSKKLRQPGIVLFPTHKRKRRYVAGNVSNGFFIAEPLTRRLSRFFIPESQNIWGT